MYEWRHTHIHTLQSVHGTCADDDDDDADGERI